MKKDSRTTLTGKLMACLRRLVRFAYKLRYGVRGAIKPPLNWNRAYSRWYRYRYAMWKIEDRIYYWTGLPDQWWKWMRGESQSNTEDEDATRSSI